MARDTNTGSPVLISWIAHNNDPFERDRDGKFRMDPHTQLPVPGPTLNLLFDPESPYSGKIRDVVLLYRDAGGDGTTHDRELTIVQETCNEIVKLDRTIRCHHHRWTGTDPTDHQAILSFLRELTSSVRRQFSGRKLIVHVSPGTPAMHTIWVLMVKCGLIDEPVELVKSYRPGERRNRQAVLPVDLDLETFYRAFRESRPRLTAPETGPVLWDPKKFLSRGLIEARQSAERFARLDVPILLMGERGTGKTTLASWIRAHGRYRKPDLDAAWPSVACGQYSDELMRSELFGHIKGAFTGADRAKQGLLTKADGDVIFLDEIGDISHGLQRLLIRAIEEKQFYPVGSDEPVCSNFRLITATNLPWKELVRRVDADFLDRIAAVRIHLPSLREIPNDLPWLWDSVWERLVRRHADILLGGRDDLRDSTRDRLLVLLRSHPLPGNLRSLERVATHLLAILAASDSRTEEWQRYAAEAAIASLEDSQPSDPAAMAKAVARSFADSSPLELPREGKLRYASIENALKCYLATELRRISTSRHQPVSELIEDVGERSLRAWAGLMANSKHRKKTACKRKKDSE